MATDWDEAIPEDTPDVALSIAAEVMSFPWTHAAAEDEHHARLFAVRDAVAVVLDRHKAAPAPVRRCGKCPLPSGR